MHCLLIFDMIHCKKCEMIRKKKLMDIVMYLVAVVAVAADRQFDGFEVLLNCGLR